MTKTELISMIDEIIYDYGATGGIMPNTLEKAKRLINYGDCNDQKPLVPNKKSKELCNCKEPDFSNRSTDSNYNQLCGNCGLIT